jgi:hypothetical protein
MRVLNVIVGMPVVEPFPSVHQLAEAIAPTGLQLDGRFPALVRLRVMGVALVSQSLNSPTKLTRSAHMLEGSSKVTKTRPSFSVGSFLIIAFSPRKLG